MSEPQVQSLFEAEPPRRIKRAGSKNQTRMLIIVLGALVLLISVAAFFLTGKGESFSLGAYKSTAVESASWTDNLELSAVVELPDSRTILAPEKAPISGLLVEEGDSVSRGQALASFDVTDLRDELLVLQRSEASRLRDVEKLDAEQNFAVRKAASDRIALVRDRDDAAKNLALQKKLAAAGSASNDDVASASLKLTLAEEKLAAADLSAEQSATLYELNRRGSMAELATVQESMADIRERIAASTVKSPLRGRVLEIDAAARESGTILNQYASIMTVGDTTKPVLKAKLPDSDAARVTKGMEVGVLLSGGATTGVVDRVGVLAYTDDSTYGTYVDLYVKPAEGVELLSGSSASLSMSLGKREGVLQVARGAWYTGASQDYVYVVQGNQAIKTKVRLGSASTKSVEIISGLDEGEVVITSSYAAFAAYETIELTGENK